MAIVKMEAQQNELVDTFMQKFVPVQFKENVGLFLVRFGSCAMDAWHFLLYNRGLRYFIGLARWDMPRLH